MISLASFRSIGRHAINMLSGIYLAAVLSYFIGKLIPAAQLVTFIVLSIAWILMGMSVMLHELRYKQDSLITVSIQILPQVLIFVTVALLVACVIARYEPVAIIGPVIGILGTVFGIFFYAACLVGTVQKRKLEEDLSNRPTEIA